MNKGLPPNRFSLMLLLIGFCLQSLASQIQSSAVTASEQKSIALVIGISDYLHLEDLEFAHLDAEAMAEEMDAHWYPSPSEVRLLVDEEATYGNIYVQLNQILLREKLVANDRLLFYFAGHATVEGEVGYEAAYLLPHTSPEEGFMGFSIAFEDLNKLATKLIDKGIEIILILDACRSGNLFSQQHQMRSIAWQLSRYVPLSELAVYFVACKANQVAHESEDWGGGHGLFTHVYLDGLQGNANSNQNESISVREMKDYLSQEVPKAALQTPQVVTLNEDLILKQFSPSLTSKRIKAIKLDSIQKLEFRSLRELKTDSTLIQEFHKAIEDRRLIEPVGNNAYFYLQELEKDTAFSNSYESLQEMLIATLVDDAQVFLNELVTAINPAFSESEYQTYIQKLEIAASLMSADHLLKPKVLANLNFIRSTRLNELAKVNQNDSLWQAATKLLEAALEISPRSSHLLLLLADEYRQLGQLDTALARISTAVTINPNYGKAHFVKANILYDKYLRTRDRGILDELESEKTIVLRLREDLKEEVKQFTIPGVNSRFQKQVDNLAIFFGINDYSGSQRWNNLRNPIKDTEAIASVLHDYYEFDTLIYRNITKEEIFAILENLQNRNFDDKNQLLLFFSGHGDFSEFRSQGYFIPYGSPLNTYEEYIPLITLGRIVNNIPCDHVLMAIDACYSGTIDESVAFRGTPNERSRIEEVYKRIIFLKRQWAFKSRLFITSGGKVRTPDGKNHSPFTEAILYGLRNAITEKDGLFTYQDLLARLSRVIPTPHMGVLPGHENGGFVFVAKNEIFYDDNALRLAKKSLSKLLPDRATNIETPPTIVNGFEEKNNFLINSEGEKIEFRKMIDGNTWLIDNLDIEIDGKSFHKTSEPNFVTLYGRLYTWEAAFRACQSLGKNWNLPTDREWQRLATAYGGCLGCTGKAEAGASFEALTSGGPSKFNATHAGYKYPNNSILGSGAVGLYWSSTEDQGNAWVFQFDNTRGELSRLAYDKNTALSCRCIKRH